MSPARVFHKFQTARVTRERIDRISRIHPCLDREILEKHAERIAMVGGRPSVWLEILEEKVLEGDLSKRSSDRERNCHGLAS
jgi:hypothetical protein